MCYILCMCVCVGASDTTTASDDPYTTTVSDNPYLMHVCGCVRYDDCVRILLFLADL
jgi:hypothetical protein